MRRRAAPSCVAQAIASVALALALPAFGTSQDDRLRIPLHDHDAWHQIEFPQYRVTEVDFAGDRLVLRVDGSAGPLIHVLPDIERHGRLEVSGTVEGHIDYPLHCPVDEQRCDDFLLRAGVIYEGTQHFNRIQRFFMPDWLNTLLERIEPGRGSGLDSIELALLGQTPLPDWRTRTHVLLVVAARQSGRPALQ